MNVLPKHNPLSVAAALALMRFLVRYRRTVLGPLWLLLSPALFIGALGGLYARIGAVDAAVFIPHLTIGFVLWTLISGFVTGSTTVFVRNRAQIMQNANTLDEIVGVDVLTNLLAFLHQVPIVIVVFLVYRVGLGAEALWSVVGLGVVIANGVWITRLFGILGARYRDLTEVFQAVMRISFLATPIIWMPAADGRGGLMGHFLTFNPFYHFLEVVRAPLLGKTVEPLSWAVVIGFTLVGFALARLFTARYSKLVPLWV